MKAVVLEIKENFAALLFDDGRILKVKNNNYAIGQVIEMNKRKVCITKKFAAIAASVAAFIMLCGTGAWACMTPYTYVSLDVNPSIEYSLNRFDTVIDVNAVNDEGKTIIDEIATENLLGEKIDVAVTETVNQLSESGYFDGDIEGGIIIATSGENEQKADDLAAELEETVENANEENGDTVEVEVIRIGLARVQEAKALGVTPGKLNLVEKLQASASDPESINIDEWLTKPVKEIMKATKENKKAAKTVTCIENEAEQLQLQEQEQEQIQDKQQTKQKDKEKLKTEKQSDNKGKSQTKKKNDAAITVVNPEAEVTETTDIIVENKNSNNNNNNNNSNNINKAAKENNASENAKVKESKSQGKQSANSSANNKK